MPSQTFTVTGMTCEHCVHAVTAEFSSLPGVTAVAVDLATGADAEGGSENHGESCDADAGFHDTSS